ncbi:MAG: hypothetical protein IPL38_11025 [Rhodobacter sp.]|nr:hypothetical protein [Rhodobacter sp.]
MRWLCAAALMLAPGLAAAQCADPIRHIVLDGGAEVTVTAQHGQRLSLSHRAMGMSYAQDTWAGIFPLTLLRDDGLLEYRWASLPESSAFGPGYTARVEGVMVSPDGQELSVATEIVVMEPAEVVIGGCRYPVLRIQVREWAGRKLVAKSVQDLNPASLMVLDVIDIDLLTGEERRSTVLSAD